MRREIVAVASCVALSFCILTSCDTPVGQGAAWGAATGAIIGGAATGHVRAASIGAAAGASRRINRRNDSAGSSCAVRSTTTGEAGLTRDGPEHQAFITVLTRDASIIFGEFRPAGLPVTLIPVGFSANRD